MTTTGLPLTSSTGILPSLVAPIEQHLGPFTAALHAGTPGDNSRIYALTPSTSSSPKYVLKLSNAPKAAARERANLSNLGRRPPTSTGLAIPALAPIALPADSSAFVMTLLPGIDGAAAFSTCKSDEQRKQLCAEFGRAARWVHSLSGSDLPGPLRVELPHNVAEETSAEAQAEQGCSTARGWLRLYLRAASARIAPAFSDLLPDPTPGESEKVQELGMEKAVAHVTTVERALASPGLWEGERNGLVFVHGDFCLPNVLFEEGEGGWKATALVDWAECGLADARYDLRAGLWSIVHNATLCWVEDAGEQEAYVGAFLEGYVGGGNDRAWVLQDWAAFLEERRASGGHVKEGCWQAWAAAYELAGEQDL